MKHLTKAAGAVAALTLGVATTVFAQPDSAHGRLEHHMGGVMHGGMGHNSAGPNLMTSAERTALQAKMRSAKTPEERQKLAEATHAEMQKRAKAKGITLPERHGPGAGFGPGSAGHMD